MGVVYAVKLTHTFGRWRHDLCRWRHIRWHQNRRHFVSDIKKGCINVNIVSKDRYF